MQCEASILTIVKMPPNVHQMCMNATRNCLLRMVATRTAYCTAHGCNTYRLLYCACALQQIVDGKPQEAESNCRPFEVRYRTRLIFTVSYLYGTFLLYGPTVSYLRYPVYTAYLFLAALASSCPVMRHVVIYVDDCIHAVVLSFLFSFSISADL